MNRAEREAEDAAEAIFTAAGWPVTRDVGGKHKLLIVSLPDGGEFRFPVSGTPSGGAHGAINLARWNARKLVRKYGGVLA